MILDEIVVKTKRRVAELKKIETLDTLKEKRENFLKIRKSFFKSLSGSDISFICEVKKASPSKGIIAKDFEYLEIAKEYESIGASAISVLTEPYFFKGNNKYLEEISKNVNIPVLRKDFIVDEYQIYEAKLIGADAILLICSILSKKQLVEYLKIAENLQLDVLVEAHDEIEVRMAVESGAKIIGVNNRNLKDFTVNIQNSINLRKLVPKDILYVSESGISTREDIRELEKHNINAVLIGETLMKSSNKKLILDTLKGKI
ncbi:indole-3-glycerol phosphate synthase TrpC [Miniphocaeibacter massiliensis]|uniref:indole-3-glycerol phosphate synthase TrpC n=1 Tax=Miniphocaeibacter massiliensis TaxID=2041841 RepID=UPI000C1BCBD7|nr:indole-3-glycerol phosphate synthase TrpC [Miniphocaeibacter massiliensis]